MADDLQVKGIVEIVTRFLGSDKSKADLAALEAQAAKLGFRIKQTSPEFRKMQADARAAGLAVQKFGKDTERAGTGVSALGRQLIGFVGFAALSRFAQQAVHDFAAFERSMLAIREQMIGLGIDAARVEPKVRAFLEGIEASGNDINAAAAAFQRFLGITGSAEGAMAAVGLAADAADRGLGDLSVNADRLAGLLQGRVQEAANSLGVAMRKANGETKTNVELLDEVIAAYAGFSDKADDAQSDLDAQAASWERLKRQIGDTASNAIPLITGALTFLINTVKTVGAVWGELIATGIAGAESFARVASKAFNLRALLTSPTQYMADVLAAVELERQFLVSSVAQSAKDIGAIWTEQAEADKQTEADKLAALEELRKVARLKLAEQEAETAKKRAEEEAKRAKELAAKRAEIEQDSADALLQARLRAAEDGSAEQLALELEVLRRAERAAIDQALAVGASTEAIEKAFQLSRSRLRQEFRDKERTSAIAFERALAAELLRIAQETHAAEQELALAQIDADLATRRLTLDEQAALESEARKIRLQAELDRIEQERQAELQKILDVIDAQLATEANPEARARLLQQRRAVELSINEKFAKKSQALVTATAAVDQQAARATARVKIDAALSAAGAVIGALQGLFGDSKALAIAQAIVDTWGAVNRTLNSLPFPANVVAAAGVAAMGLANVARIRSASAGGGGGGSATIAAPSSRAASAAAPTGNATGAPIQFPQQQTISNVSNRGDTINFEFRGVNVLGDRRSTLRNLRRLLDNANQGRRL